MNIINDLDSLKYQSADIPDHILKKYKEEIQDISSLKSMLQETIEDIEKESFHELALDLSMLTSTENITKQQGEHLKEIILGLNEKLKILQAVELILQETEKKSKKDIEAREDMQKEVQKSCTKMDELKKQQEKLVKDMQETLNKTQKKLMDADANNRKNEKKINELNGEIKILTGENNKLKAELKNFADMEKMIRDLQKNIKSLEENRDKMRDDFKKLQGENDKITAQKDSEFQKVIAENEKLEKNNEDKQAEISSLKVIINKHESTIITLNSNIESYLSEIRGLKDQESKAISMEALAKKHQQECMKANENIQKTTAKFSEVIKSINQEKLKLLKNTGELQETIKNLKETIQSLEEKSSAESIKCKDFKSQNEALQQKINASIDSQHISRQLLKLHSNFIKSKLKFNLDSAIFVKTHVQTSYDLLNLARLFEELKEVLMERDEEIFILKDIIAELQRRIPYVPAKDDPVDCAMAEYVNSLDEPLQIPFVREDPGIYLFGSKRIFIKLDNGKLSSKIYIVRIGGGTILLDEYVDSYTNNELLKIEERRRKKSLSSNKNLMGKIIEKISNFLFSWRKTKKH